MNQPSILAILRRLAEASPSSTDAELLNRYAINRDEDAFTALVRRHGRLVWSVCQNLAGADAVVVQRLFQSVGKFVTRVEIVG